MTPGMQFNTQLAPTIFRSVLDIGVLQVVGHDAMPQFPTMGIAWPRRVAKVTGIHVIESAAILPATLHDLVLEYAAQHNGLTAAFINKIICVGDSTTAAAGETVDVLVFTVFAEKDPAGHRVILMLHCWCRLRPITSKARS